MYRDDEFFLAEIKKDELLFNIFNAIGNYSVTEQKGPQIRIFQANFVLLSNLIEHIKSIVCKDDVIVIDKINRLTAYGLCEYKTKQDNPHHNDNSNSINDDKRLAFFTELGLPKTDCEISLTQQVHMGCSGVSLYRKIILDKESKEFDKKMAGEIESAFDEILKPYADRISTIEQSVETKIKELNHTVDSGIIKNVQVISVYAGVISLLFANIMGIKDFTSIGAIGLLIINLSIASAIFALTLFTNILILNQPIKMKTLLACIGILLFIAVPIVLLKLQIL